MTTESSFHASGRTIFDFIRVLLGYTDIAPELCNLNNYKVMIEIPKGSSKDDIMIRKQIIYDFYQSWKLHHPELRMYNQSLREYINIRYVSIDETCAHASKNYFGCASIRRDSYVS